MKQEERKDFLFSGIAVAIIIALFMIIFALVFVGVGYLISNIHTNTPAEHTTLTDVVVDDQRVDSVWVFKN